MTPIPGILAVLTLAQEPTGRALVSPDPPREVSSQTYDLHHAAYRGDLEAVRAAVQAGADVNEVRIRVGLEGKAPETPLFIAAYQRQTEIVRYLLAAGADPDLRCTEEGTALTIAAARPGTAEILKALLAAGADVLGPRPKNISALGWSAHGGDPESFVLLLDASRAAGISADEEGKVFERLRHRSDLPRHVMERLMGWKPEGVPALHSAARSRTLVEVERLLASGAASSEPDEQGWTALHWAVFSESVEKARPLLAAGADPNARTSRGCTPLMLAARCKDPELARLLLEAGADPQAFDDDHWTALHVAAGRASPETIWLLLEAGGIPNVPGPSEITPLMIAESRRWFLGEDVRWAFEGRTRPEHATEPGKIELASDLPAPRIAIRRAEVGRDPKRGLAGIEIFLGVEPFPLDLAFDVYWRQGEDTFPAPPFSLPANTAFEGKKQIFAPTEGLGSEIELILIPSPAVAMSKLPDPPSAIWGKEVRLRCELVEIRER